MRSLAAYFSCAVITATSFVLTGYVVRRADLYTWPMNGTPMALPTAICLLMLGLSIIALWWSVRGMNAKLTCLYCKSVTCLAAKCPLPENQRPANCPLRQS